MSSLMDDLTVDPKVRAMLKAMWDEPVELEPEPEPVYRKVADMPYALGTLVVVTGDAPDDWNFACAGFPAKGQVGVIGSDPCIPEGRCCVRFGDADYDLPDDLLLTSGSKYTDLHDRHITLYLPDECVGAQN